MLSRFWHNPPLTPYTVIYTRHSRIVSYWKLIENKLVSALTMKLPHWFMVLVLWHWVVWRDSNSRDRGHLKYLWKGKALFMLCQRYRQGDIHHNPCHQTCHRGMFTLEKYEVWAISLSLQEICGKSMSFINYIFCRFQYYEGYSFSAHKNFLQ